MPCGRSRNYEKVAHPPSIEEAKEPGITIPRDCDSNTRERAAILGLAGVTARCLQEFVCRRYLVQSSTDEFCTVVDISRLRRGGWRRL